MMNYSDRFQGIMCFTADEAINLYEQGFDDLFIAYPTWDENAIFAKCLASCKRRRTITVTIDSVMHIERLEEIAKAENGVFLAAIDIDLSSQFPGLHFGVYRSHPDR